MKGRKHMNVRKAVKKPVAKSRTKKEPEAEFAKNEKESPNGARSGGCLMCGGCQITGNCVLDS